MTTLPPDDPAAAGERPAQRAAWRQRYDAVRARGVPLDPTSEPVDGVEAYPTDYDPTHLLITSIEPEEERLGLLAAAAGDFGWGVRLELLDGRPTELAPAVERAQRARRELDLPTIYRVAIFPSPRPDRDDQPVPPIDAWRLLQRARARAGAARDTALRGVSLDHVLTVDPFRGKTNPFSGKTNPFRGKTNPYGAVNAPGAEAYASPGSGGRQVVQYIGPAPARTLALADGGRRPVVAVLDTGCGAHPWLPDDIVTRDPVADAHVIGLATPAIDPEATGDVAGPFDGEVDESAGHGTFIAGIVRQVCPEADIVAIRVADSQGTVLEGDFMLAVRSLVKAMTLPAGEGGRAIDVINLSLGYYHETPEDELFDRTLADLLLAARRRGCAVVCSAGNDSTDRPAFPAALWAWPEAEFEVGDPEDVAPHVSVGALNPNSTMALFSNLGPWVRTYAPGAAVMSTHPAFDGGVQAGTRDDRDGMRRETIDPDDFAAGFALWSGTSFAAPHVAALLAADIAEPLMSATLVDDAARVGALRKASEEVCARLDGRGPLRV